MSSAITQDLLACPLEENNDSDGNARRSHVPSWREKWLRW